MRKFPVLPATAALIALAVIAFILLPSSGSREAVLEPIASAPQSAMPVLEDAPEAGHESAQPVMGDVEEALNAAPAPDASVMPAVPPSAPVATTQGEGDFMAALGEDRWVLIWLENQAVPEGERAPNIVFNMDEGSVSGYAGCNRYTGSFTAEDKTVSFGPIAATRMACDQLGLEGAYIAMLGRVAGWALTEDIMSLRDDEGVTIARFKRP